MEASVQTSFNTLPTRLQTEILQFLTQVDIKLARLVCTYWFRLLGFVRTPGFHLNNNKIDLLQTLQKSFHPIIQFLRISSYTETLPICTSTRCGIPKARVLELSAGNSVENVMKLLRNYAKHCEGLTILSNSLEKVAPFRLKGLTYDSLRCLVISFQDPSNNLENSNHLNALIQFLKTKFPNLRAIVLKSAPFLSGENFIVQEFSRAMDTFLEYHGQQLVEFKYQYIPHLVVVRTFKHLCNLENLSLEFKNNIPHQEQINEIRESFKLIKKLKSLEWIDNTTMFEEEGLHYEFMMSMLKENRKCIKKFCHEKLGSGFLSLHWIPIDYEIELKELELRFQGRFLGLDFIMGHPKLTSVTKLLLHVNSLSTAWFNLRNGISRWMVDTLPNLKSLTLDYPSARLKISEYRFLICKLVNLKKLFIVNGYSRWTDESRNWFTQQNENEFIKSIPFNDGLEISISRPFPNNLFDENRTLLFL